MKALKKEKPRNRRIIFTDREPIFKLALSNDKAVIVQNIAVNTAAISPV